MPEICLFMPNFDYSEWVTFIQGQKSQKIIIGEIWPPSDLLSLEWSYCTKVNRETDYYLCHTWYKYSFSPDSQNPSFDFLETNHFEILCVHTLSSLFLGVLHFGFVSSFTKYRVLYVVWNCLNSGIMSQLDLLIFGAWFF